MKIMKIFLEDRRMWAGIMLFLVGGIALMGIITAEVVYPGYTTQQEISDLGASRPPDSIIHQPSATIFNTTMLICGALILFSIYLLNDIFKDRFFTISMVLLGVGIFGVGVFPGNRVPWHLIFALLTFVSGGFTMLSSSRVVRTTFKYLCIIYGLISLTALSSTIFLGDANPLNFLEYGGIERWVVYPLLLWITGFGGYLLGDRDHDQEQKR